MLARFEDLGDEAISVLEGQVSGSLSDKKWPMGKLGCDWMLRIHAGTAHEGARKAI